jgi:hypothetical protein
VASVFGQIVHHVHLLGSRFRDKDKVGLIVRKQACASCCWLQTVQPHRVLRKRYQRDGSLYHKFSIPGFSRRSDFLCRATSEPSLRPTCGTVMAQLGRYATQGPPCGRGGAGALRPS